MRILVADDDEQSLKLFHRIFQNLCFDIVFTGNGEDALEKISVFEPDLAVLDITMPGIDGYDVCRRIKSDSRTSDVMVLLLSGRNGLEDRLKGYEVRADDYIVKPYEPQELVAKVRILLRLKNAQDQVKAINENLERLVIEKTRALVKKERQAIIGLMVQGIVHNLKGPLTLAQWAAESASENINALLNKLGKDTSGNIKRAKDIESDIINFEKQIDKTFQLVGTLLIKGRQDADEFMRELDINDLIQKECEILEADIVMKHEVCKQQNLDPSLPKIRGIYSDFSQVIYNLIKNALDAMKHSLDKRLIITTAHDFENVFISIADTGAGISEKYLDRIFDPFFTTKTINGETENSDEPTGTGLGLHTCRQLMREYGGIITVESDLGVGTTFTILLPKFKNGCYQEKKPT